MTGKSRRLFIALPADGEKVFESLRGTFRDLERYGSILKPVQQSSLHITMKFLGDVDEERYLRLTELFKSLEGESSITYTLKGIGCFPSVSAPSVIWAGIDCDMKRMSGLFSRVEELCSGLGFQKEARRFTPHLTLARVKRGRDVPAGLKDLIKGGREKLFADSSFDRLVLFESKLNSDGSKYFIRSEIRLA